MSTQPLADSTRRSRWPWVVLGLSLFWTALIRVPLVLNAHDHMDSDLAVDGLTLLDAVHGHWRWHYPGTPYMGILPMLSGYPQALVYGVTPTSLASGGTIIWLLVVASTFWLAAQAYGLNVAGWAIIPLAFSSLGTIWLSGRITGGHLLTLVWHTCAFAGLLLCLRHGRYWRVALLGLWCGLGLYLDAMFLFTLAGIVPAALLAWMVTGRPRSSLGLLALFVVAMTVGLLPREIGRWVDPYDAYPSQFQATLEPAALIEHARLLGLHCLPRLIAGKELTQLERAGSSLVAKVIGLLAGGASGLAVPAPSLAQTKDEWLAVSFVAAFVLTLVRLARHFFSLRDPAGAAVSGGILVSACLIVGAFLVNRNVFNSDNYRYLIFLLTPWSLGFGLIMNDLARRSWATRLAACLALGLLIEVMTSNALFWYRDERLYVDRSLIPAPVRVSIPDWSELTVVADTSAGAPGSSFSYQVSPDVSHVFGGYWDVYKMAFLSGGRVVGIPYPMYPNRFPGWSRGLGPGQGKLLIVRPRMTARRSRSNAPAEQGTGIVGSARKTNWRSIFQVPWVADGRDPAELKHLQVVVP